MNAQMRRWFYLLSGLAAALVPILIQTGVLEAGTGENSLTLLGTLGSMIGATGAGLAAHQTHKQIKDGVHDPALPPIEQMQEAANKVVAQANEAQQNMDRLREISGALIEGTLGQVPVVGPAAGSLADQVLNQIIPR